MKQYKKMIAAGLLLGAAAIFLFTACTKYGNGFISPTMQYAVSEFTVVKGQTSSSYSLIPDGSSIPLHIRWTHMYDSTGKIVDSLFSKKYTVSVWTAVYDPKTDTTYAQVMAKRSTAEMPPIVLNESSGVLQANPATLNLPAGSYTMDIEVTNSAGKRELKNVMKIILKDGKALETAPESGAFSNSLALVGNAAAALTVFNGQNNPYDSVVITRFADTPNTVILKITDRNGVPFSPRTGDLTKRPNTGLNPVPPYLQNLQDYAPDTYQATDSAIAIRYPFVPFPSVSLGNGFNMYYMIKSSAIHIDSTATWASNPQGLYYKGAKDSRYLGQYKDDRYNYYIRIPMRVQIPGAYIIWIKILNITHR